MAGRQTISATEFKAKCLNLFDQVESRKLDKVIITKRGKTVAVLTPPQSSEDAVNQIHGFMRGSVIIPEGFDLTEPVGDTPFEIDNGLLHG
jgi:prevent-host-death family protein